MKAFRWDRTAVLRPSVDGEFDTHGLIWCHLINAPAVLVFHDGKAFCNACKGYLYDGDHEHEVLGTVQRPF